MPKLMPKDIVDDVRRVLDSLQVVPLGTRNAIGDPPVLPRIVQRMPEPGAQLDSICVILFITGPICR